MKTCGGRASQAARCPWGHRLPVRCLCQPCNIPTHSRIHFSFQATQGIYIFNPCKGLEGEKGSVLRGLGERLGRGSELRAGSGKISVCSPRGGRGRRGRRRKAAWTSKEPKQRQGREKQPVLGLPVLLSGIGCSDGAPDSGMSQLCFSSPGTCHGQERARLQVTQTTKCRGPKKGRFPTISSVSHLVTLTGIFLKLLILR